MRYIAGGQRTEQDMFSPSAAAGFDCQAFERLTNGALSRMSVFRIDVAHRRVKLDNFHQFFPDCVFRVFIEGVH
jgi:hypothetical protein